MASRRKSVSEEDNRWVEESYKLVKESSESRQVQGVYIADGFRVDCHALLGQCADVRPLRWEDFARIWKSSHFSYVFRCRPTAAEMAELSEELLLIAKTYFVKPENTFWESVAALYLLYGLMYMQPLDRFAQVRLTPPDMRRVLEVEAEARRLKQLDVLYCLGRMQIEGMMKLTRCEREYGLERPIRRYLEGNSISVDNMRLETGVITQSSSELNLLKELSKTMQDYTDAKALLKENKAADRNLEYCDAGLASRLGASLAALQRSGKYKSDEVEAASRASIVSRIKNRAMRDEVQAARHRKTIAKRMRGRQKTKKAQAEETSDSDEEWEPSVRSRVPAPSTPTPAPTAAASAAASAAAPRRNPTKEEVEALAAGDSTCDSVCVVASEHPVLLVEDSRSRPELEPEPEPAPDAAPLHKLPGIFGL